MNDLMINMFIDEIEKNAGIKSVAKKYVSLLKGSRSKRLSALAAKGEKMRNKASLKMRKIHSNRNKYLSADELSRSNRLYDSSMLHGRKSRHMKSLASKASRNELLTRVLTGAGAIGAVESAAYLASRKEKVKKASYDRPGSRDGTGPFKGSFRRNVEEEDTGRRLSNGEVCPITKKKLKKKKLSDKVKKAFNKNMEIK